jgi:alkylated DNA nucleotide flippase Atl1
MHRLDSLSPAEASQYPWWRVINSRGMISTTCREHSAELQGKLLQAEAIEVRQKQDGTRWVDLQKYLWHP